MSQQVIVDRDLEFRGAALYQPNIKGIPMCEKKVTDFGFEGTSTLYGWTSSVANGTALAHASVDGGAMTLTASGTANDCGEFLHTAQWSPYLNCGMEAKVKISQITSVNVCVGFVDAYTNTNDKVAMEISGTTFTNMTNTADACGMVFDTGANTAVWYCLAADNTTEGTPVAANGSLIPVADTYFKVRVQTDSDGNVTFYYASGNTNNQLVAVGYLPEAVAHAAGNLLAPYIGFIARTTVAEVCTISRVTVWQDN